MKRKMVPLIAASVGVFVIGSAGVAMAGFDGSESQESETEAAPLVVQSEADTGVLVVEGMPDHERRSSIGDRVDDRQEPRAARSARRSNRNPDGHDMHSDHGQTMGSMVHADHEACDNPSEAEVAEAEQLVAEVTAVLDQLPRWQVGEPVPEELDGGFRSIGGKTDGLPYLHYLRMRAANDGLFMDGTEIEGIMYGTNAEGVVIPTAAMYFDRDASGEDMDNLNCLFVFHDHGGDLRMMHVFHESYPGGSFDHSADIAMVRSMP